MKVKELIEQLKEYNQDKEVYVIDNDSKILENEGWKIITTFEINCSKDKELNAVYIQHV